MKTVGYITTGIVTMVLAILYSGYALTVLWGWFMVPTFNVPSLSIPAAIGLILIVSYLTQKLKAKERPQPFSETWRRGISEAAQHAVVFLKYEPVGFVEPPTAVAE